MKKIPLTSELLFTKLKYRLQLAVLAPIYNLKTIFILYSENFMNNDELKFIIPAERIERTIYIIRDRKVILDQDLAALYGVGTRDLNKAVSRNRKRFPEDFIFKLTHTEWDCLMFQIGTSKTGRGGRRKLPMAFTEHGVAMAANLLKSERAIKISVEIVRAFIRLREFLSSRKAINKEISELKSFVLKHSHANDREFQRVWAAFEKLITPPPEKEQPRIGFRIN